MSEKPPAIFRFASVLLLGADGITPAPEAAGSESWWKQFITALAGRAGTNSDAARMPEIPEQSPTDAGLSPESDDTEAVSVEDPLDGPPGQLVGFRGRTAAQVVGITQRQLDYWDRTRLVTPSIRSAASSGGLRLYSFKDLLVLKVIKRLLDAGISLENTRVVVQYLRRNKLRDLAGITLFSDGQAVYEATSPEEAVDALQKGQGVFGIAVGGAIHELRARIIDFSILQGDNVRPVDSQRDWLLRSAG